MQKTLFGCFVFTSAFGFAPSATSQSLFPEAKVGRQDQLTSELVLADMNSDGRLDGVTLASSGTVIAPHVLLGQGDGILSTSLEGPTVPTSSVRSIEVGRLNADSIPDVATLTGNNTVAIYSGLGDGSLSAPAEFAVGNNPRDLEIADLNEDLQQDIVVFNSGSTDLTVLLGDGNGGFVASTVDLGFSPGFGHLDDLNGDGFPEAIFVRISVVSDLVVMMGNGDGTFQSAVSYGVGVGPSRISTADFDEDGELDVAVSDSFSNEVVVLFGQGSGVLGGSISLVGNTPLSLSGGDIQAQDLDHDGHVDIALASNFGIVRFYGQGDGTFDAAVPVVDWQSGAFDFGDLNGDGELDLVSSVGLGLAVALGTGNRSYQVSADIQAGDRPFDLVSADFDGDGSQDLAVLNQDSDDVTLLSGDGSGDFVASGAFPIVVGTTFPRALASADFDGDGSPDLAVAMNSGSGPVSVLLGTGTGFGAPQSLLTSDDATDVVAAEVTGDSFVDLVLCTDDLVVLPGNGDGTFDTEQLSDVGEGPVRMATGHFNADTSLDLAVVRRTQFGKGSLAILSGDGVGGFTVINAFSFGFTPENVAVGDFDSDGNDDLIVSNRNAAELKVLRGDGAGGFFLDVSYPVLAVGLFVADVDNDGVLDVLAGGGNEVSLLLGQGDGSFGSPLHYMAPFGISAVLAGDFDGDAVLDIAATNASSSQVSVLIDTGDLINPTVFCAAKLASAGCLPSMSFSGQSSASQPIPFQLDASDVLNNKNGLLFYGYGDTALPFLGGTLCATPPLRRTSLQSSGGNPPPNDCSGTYSWNMNTWTQSGADPFLVPGAFVTAQYWFRDPAASFGTGLTDAVRFTVGL